MRRSCYLCHDPARESDGSVPNRAHVRFSEEDLALEGNIGKHHRQSRKNRADCSGKYRFGTMERGGLIGPMFDGGRVFGGFSPRPDSRGEKKCLKLGNAEPLQ